MAAERRDRKCCVTPAQVGRLQSSAAQNCQVSGYDSKTETIILFTKTISIFAL